MNILALDASTKSTGWAYFKDEKLISWGTFKASNSDVITRISSMIFQLDSFLQKNKIEKIILEEVRPQEQKGEDGVYYNIKTYKALIYLQAAIVFLLHENYPFIQLNFVYPNQWRSECGIHTGRGIKRQELKSIDIDFAKQHFLIQENINDDIADAICIGFSFIKKEKTKNDFIEEINWE